MLRQDRSNEANNAIPEKQHLTLLGDSSLDNEIWVNGEVIMERSLDESNLTFKKNYSIFAKQKLSVVKNIESLFPDHIIHKKQINAHYTTESMISGVSTFPYSSTNKLLPLQDAEESIKQSQHIIVSFGASDLKVFQEALNRVAPNTLSNRNHFLESNYEGALAAAENNYLAIIKKIREWNPTAKIILLTCSYPSVSHCKNDLYPFLQNIGETFPIVPGRPGPMYVAQAIMKKIYQGVFNQLSADSNIVVGDVASSLNPFNTENYVSRTTLSGQGGKKIAQILKYLINSDSVVSGQAYRFYPDFFTTDNPQLHVEGSSFQSWNPANPWDLSESYSLEQEKVFRAYKGDDTFPHTLLVNLKTAISKLDESSPLVKHALALHAEAEKLLTKLPECDLRKWKMSVILALHVLNTPKTCKVEENTASAVLSGDVPAASVSVEQTNPEYLNAINLLKRHAEQSSIGKAHNWKKFTGALLTLAGAALLGLGIASVLPLGIGVAVVSSLLIAGGASFFYLNRQKSLAKDSDRLTKEASRQLSR